MEALELGPGLVDGDVLDLDRLAVSVEPAGGVALSRVDVLRPTYDDQLPSSFSLVQLLRLRLTLREMGKCMRYRSKYDVCQNSSCFFRMGSMSFLA